MKPVDVSFPLWWSPEKHGVSNSILSDWLDCRRLAWFRLHGIRTLRPFFALIFGTVVDDFITEAYRGTELSVEELSEKTRQSWLDENPNASAELLELLESSLIFAEAVLPHYFDYWRQSKNLKWVSLNTLETVRLPSVGIDLKVKFDGVFERSKKLWLMETKTHSRLNEGTLVDRVHFSLQNKLYMVALRYKYDRIPAGFIYNMIRRPGLKQKKEESLITFAKRCAGDVRGRSDWYFNRFEVHLTRQDLDEAEAEIVHLISEISAWAKGNLAHYPNTGHCENKYGACPFLAICGRSDWTNFTKGKHGRS